MKYGMASLLIILSLAGMAQEKKQLTLEDLIPGGETFYKFRPENIYGMQWWDNSLAYYNADKSALVVKQPQALAKEKLIFLKEVNDALQKAGLGRLAALYSVSYPQEMKGMLISAPKYYALYNEGVVTWMMNADSLRKNNDFCSQNRMLAYTIDNNLWIANDKGKTAVTHESEGIVCGQGVHRNEFGIKKGTFWSPKGNYLAFYRMDESMVDQYPLVDIDQRIAQLNNTRYPMAGMTSHKVTVGIYNLSTGKTVYLQAGDPTDRYFTNITWSPDETKIYMIELNREQNRAQLVRYNVANGEKEAVLFEETDPNYVEPLNPILFVKGNDNQFIYQSQRDGFRHLYLYNTDGKQLKQLTSGNWLVQEVLGFDESGKNVFYTSTEKSPIESHLYKLNLKTGKQTLLTPAAGVHTAFLSPSGEYAVDNYSSASIPRVIDVINTGNAKITNLLIAANPYEEYKMPQIEIGTVKAADSVTDLYYRLIKPSDFDPSKKYPVIIYVYGGPHAQMIHNTFNWDARGWDIYMAQKGYVMFTLDNRGSENRGRDFEQAVFRRLGIEEGKDQIKGVEFLKTLPYIDVNRIGVHGWSFGGHITTALLLRYPDIFKVGVAGGPVIDWSLYEAMYGERYMNTPQTNPEGYQETNLNNLAGNLKGHLMIIHDDNDHTCVLQHALSFMKACIEARTYPDLFIYPGHDHNVMGRDRVHLHEKITRYFEDYLH